MKSMTLPYSSKCFVCGKDNLFGLKIKFNVIKNEVQTEFIAQEEHQGYNGVVHGGILSTLLDEAMGWAPTLITKRMTFSAELTIRFLKPAPLHIPLIITAKSSEINKRLYTSTGQITDKKGNLYTTGQGKFIPLSEKETDDVNSWLIYDEFTLKVFDK